MTCPLPLLTTDLLSFHRWIQGFLQHKKQTMADDTQQTNQILAGSLIALVVVIMLCGGALLFIRYYVPRWITVRGRWCLWFEGRKEPRRHGHRWTGQDWERGLPPRMQNSERQREGQGAVADDRGLRIERDWWERRNDGRQSIGTNQTKKRTDIERLGSVAGV